MSGSTPEVHVVSGNLVTAAPSVVSPAVRDDIRESNLFCQMAADKSGSRFDDPVAWLNAYHRTLGVLSWLTKESNTRSYPVRSLNRSVSVMSILEDNFSKWVDPRHWQQIEASIELWSRLSAGDEASDLFNEKTHVESALSGQSSLGPQTESVINLQVGIAHDETLVSGFCVYFKTSASVGDDVFNQNFSARELLGNIGFSMLKANFLGSGYERVRKTVKDKLDKNDNIRKNILLITERPVTEEHLSLNDAQQFIDQLDI